MPPRFWDAVSFAVSSIIGGVVGWFPAMSFVAEWGWWIAAFGFGGVILGRIIAAPYRMAREDAAQREADSDSGPNLWIYDAFCLVDPELSGNEFSKPEWVGKDIRDWLASGEIRSWGNRTRGRSRPAARTQIPANYWEKADFTYQFMAGDSLVHARPSPRKQGVPSYAEIYFNRTEFKRVMKMRGYASE